MSFFLRIFAHKWINVSWFVLILHCCNNAKLEIFILRVKETWHVTMGWITFCILGAEFLILFFSPSHSLALKLSTFLGDNFIIWVETSLFEWKHHPLSLKWPSFQIIPLFERKMVAFWWLESERKKETQIPRLNIRSIW